MLLKIRSSGMWYVTIQVVPDVLKQLGALFFMVEAVSSDSSTLNERTARQTIQCHMPEDLIPREIISSE
jgi:hypothetical protein